jgi:hypothetical protein
MSSFLLFHLVYFFLFINLIKKMKII